MLMTTIFYHVDNFCKVYEKTVTKKTLTDGKKEAKRKPSMVLSDILTIIIYFHHSGYRTFKQYYEHMILQEHKTAFKALVSYNRFVELMQDVMIPLSVFSISMCTTNVSRGIYFIDSMALKVSHNARISSHKVFAGFAQRGKTSTGWFFGFKFHLVINHLGEIVSFSITSGNVSDCNENLISRLTKKIRGKLFGDRGYLSSKLFKQLWQRGIHLITKIRKNMKNQLIPMIDKFLLRKRAVIESVNNLLKSSHQIEHSRHRNIQNFFVNLCGAVAAYNFREKKPSIGLRTARFLQDFV